MFLGVRRSVLAMSLPSHDQCALNANGVLKDASEIAFFNDPDDDEPISPTPALAASASSSRLQSSTLDDFFHNSGIRLAKVVAGTRRASTRQKRPTAKVLEGLPTAVPSKRSADAIAAELPAAKRIATSASSATVVDDSDSAFEDADDNVPALQEVDDSDDEDEDDDEDPANEEYERLKAMGDADRNVRFVSLTLAAGLVLVVWVLYSAAR